VRVIGSLENQLVTEERMLARDWWWTGAAVADPARDVLKMAVIDRHKASGSAGAGLHPGFGLAARGHGRHRGARSSQPGRHRRRRCVDAGGRRAVVATWAAGWRWLRATQCARAAAAGGWADERPPDRRSAPRLRCADRRRADLGSPLHDPFMAMSFMALEVIPKLKLTDQGLVDVAQFAIVPLFVD
jgi:adenine deaminase